MAFAINGILGQERVLDLAELSNGTRTNTNTYHITTAVTSTRLASPEQAKVKKEESEQIGKSKE